MKSLKVAMTWFVLFGVLSAIPVSAAELQNKEQDSNYTVVEDVHDDLYVVGEEKVTVDGNVYGDLFVAGGMIYVNGDVEGDIYIAGGQVSIRNEVMGSVFAAGGQIDIDGTVNRSIYIAGGEVDINADIQDDVLIFAGQVNLSGTVGDDVRGTGGYIVIDSKVNGDVLASGGTLNLNGDVLGDVLIAGEDLSVDAEMIGGNLTVYGKEDNLELSSDIEVLGNYKIEEPKAFESNVQVSTRPFLKGFSFAGFFTRILFSLLNTLGIFILGMVMLKVAPVKTEQTLRQMKNANDLLKSFAVGVIAFPVLAAVSLVMLLSFVGWPSLWVLLSLAVVSSSLALPLFSLRLGRYITNRIKISDSEYVKLAVGLVVLTIVFAIPCLGSLLQLFVTATAVGAMLQMHYKNYQNAQAHIKGTKSK